MADVLHFLLVPDRASGRSVRRALASNGARWGTVVGTFGELVDQACKAYLLKSVETDWKDRLGKASRELTDAFWSESLKADPDGSVAVLDRELRRLLEALGPGRDIAPIGKSRLSDRGKRHLADLSRLHETMDRVLPDGLATIRKLLAADKADAHRIVKVYRKAGFPTLSPWQEALLGKLATDATEAANDPELETILASRLVPEPAGKAKSALAHLQENLFRAGPSQVPLDDSVTCLGVRDHLEAAEIAAGMIQKALAGDFQLEDVGHRVASSGRRVLRRSGAGSLLPGGAPGLRSGGVPPASEPRWRSGVPLPCHPATACPGDGAGRPLLLPPDALGRDGWKPARDGDHGWEVRPESARRTVRRRATDDDPHPGKT